MTRRLHLVRHAKSAWDNPGHRDIERLLNKRGRRDAPRMGAALAELLPLDFRIHVSPAARARLTLEGLCEGWRSLAAVPADVDDELYTFSRDVLIDWLRERDEDESACLVIGHNPALTELVNWLDPPARLENLPTAAYAGLELDIDRWSDLACGCGRLVTLIRPRDL